MAEQTSLALDSTAEKKEIAKLKPEDEARQRLVNFNRRLKRMPAKKLVKQYKVGSDSFEYLPIEYCEDLIRQISFGQYKIEVVHYGHIFNEVTVHVRVHYKHPVSGEWLFVDGLGSAVIMQDKDTKVAEFAQHKKKNALQTMLPKAKAVALKNAVKSLGNLFGGHLNRKDEDEYDFITGTLQPLNK
jgi:hypothetical protein